MYSWSNTENFGTVRLMVRKKISSQTDRQTRRIYKRLFSDEKSANKDYKYKEHLIYNMLLNKNNGSCMINKICVEMR